MKIAALPNNSGSRYWRLELPFKYLNRIEGVEAVIADKYETIDDVCKWADVVVVQSIVDREKIAALYAYQQEQGLKLVADVDDWLEVDADNPHRVEHEQTDAPFVILKVLGIADMITTTTKPLQKKLNLINQNVSILPNYIDLEMWEKPVKPKVSSKIRVGWTGSITHLEDLKMIREPLSRIAGEFPNVQFVFVGDLRIKELFKGINIEVMPGVKFDLFPTRLSGLRLDVGIAPLTDREFNKHKSNIKWQEYSVNHIPGVYSPTVYKSTLPKFDGKYGMIAENDEQWYQALKNLIINENLRRDIGENAYYAVKTRFDLADHAHKWLEVYKSL